ncbi:MAG: hypothetical protein AVDCRST_MAG23-1255, partial [uncultured Sphingosinicella sp.]
AGCLPDRGLSPLFRDEQRLRHPAVAQLQAHGRPAADVERDLLPAASAQQPARGDRSRRPTHRRDVTTAARGRVARGCGGALVRLYLGHGGV